MAPVELTTRLFSLADLIGDEAPDLFALARQGAAAISAHLGVQDMPDELYLGAVAVHTRLAFEGLLDLDGPRRVEIYSGLLARRVTRPDDFRQRSNGLFSMPPLDGFGNLDSTDYRPWFQYPDGSIDQRLSAAPTVFQACRELTICTLLVMTANGYYNGHLAGELSHWVSYRAPEELMPSN